MAPFLGPEYGLAANFAGSALGYVSSWERRVRGHQPNHAKGRLLKNLVYPE